MSFRMINTKAQGTTFNKNNSTSSKNDLDNDSKTNLSDPMNPTQNQGQNQKKQFTQEELDLIDENFTFREDKIKNFSQSANPLLSEYRKKLLVEEKTFKRETILFDVNLKKWILKDN